jgi:hypothetical protein
MGSATISYGRTLDMRYKRNQTSVENRPHPAQKWMSLKVNAENTTLATERILEKVEPKTY